MISSYKFCIHIWVDPVDVLIWFSNRTGFWELFINDFLKLKTFNFRFRTNPLKNNFPLNTKNDIDLTLRIKFRIISQLYCFQNNKFVIVIIKILWLNLLLKSQID